MRLSLFASIASYGVLAALTVGLLPNKACASTTPYFNIVNKYSGNSMDLIGGNTANGAVIETYASDSGSANQLWSLVPVDGAFEIVAYDTGSALSVSNDATTNGAIVWDWQFNNDPSQLWNLVDAGNGWFYIVNVRSGLVLDDDGYGTGNDNPIDTWSNNSTNGSGADLDNQLWKIQPNGTYYIKAASGRYICIQNQGSTDGSPIIQYDQENNPWFKWQFTSEGNGWFSLFSLNAPTRVISVDNDSTAAAEDTQLWDYNSSDHSGGQQVRIEPKLDGHFKFYFELDGMSWDMPGGNTADNVPLQQYPDNSNSWQEFSLERTDNVAGPENTIESVSPSSVPAPASGGAMSFEILNGTNGAYANNQIYWGVLGINPANGQWSYLSSNGTLQPISAALNTASGCLVKNGVDYANIYNTINPGQWISIPQITSARMYISRGSPCYITTYNTGFAGPNIDNPSDPNSNVNFDFIEFTIDGAGYHGNTTRVDMFGFPIQHRLINVGDTFDQTVGENEIETTNGLPMKFQSTVPSQFTSLATVQSPYRIVAPIHGSFAAGQPNANYFSGYSSIDTQDILLGTGAAADPDTCAAINRHVYTLPEADWNVVGDYYGAAPANYYAQFWHQHDINALAYGFCYDDVNGQASYLSVANPLGLILRIGQ